MGVSVNNYVMGSKSIMFFAPSQRHFKFVFDSSNTLVIRIL